MNNHELLNCLFPPQQPRRNTWRSGTIQIMVTRACDRACAACTQGSQLKVKDKENLFISLDNFELAVKSLQDYFGVVGIFGGNPALHPEFPKICEILCDYIPFVQRGLWCNNPLKHIDIIAKTFNPRYSNLNVHQDQKAYDTFKKGWPGSRPFGLTEDSSHSPVHLSMFDLKMTEGERNKYISQCDINKYWSALVGQFRGELRGWFCEIAGSQSMLFQHDPKYPDTGIPVTPTSLDWWRGGMEKYAHQVSQHCHNCAVPLKGSGRLSNSTTDELTSKTYLPIFNQRINRQVIVIDSLPQIIQEVKVVTNYHPEQGAS